MPQSRQLAAIMFTDIVGYTLLMGSDEQKAFQLLKKNRQIQQPLIKQYNGTWIKELGNGQLDSFNTVSDRGNIGGLHNDLFSFQAGCIVGCAGMKIGDEEYFFPGRDLH